MKRIPALIFALLATLIFNGCGTMAEGVEEVTPENREIIFATKGALFGGGSEGIQEGGEAVYTEMAWSALKTQMGSVNPVSEDIANVTIDFQTEMIIYYIDKVQPSGGYEILIDQVLETDKEIVVVGQKVSPKEGATSVLTQPYFILSTSKSKKPVRFELTQQ